MIRESEGMPYDDRSVTFIRWLPDGIDAAHDKQTKREWLRTDAKLYVAWTGRYRTDVFEIDRVAAKKALDI